MKTPKFIEAHWRPIMVVLAVLVIYAFATRKTTRTIGTVDASGEGMTVNGA